MALGAVNYTVYGQFEVDFGLPEMACKGEAISPSNNSIGAIGYQWEFCAGGLQQEPFTAQPSLLINDANAPDGLSIQKENGNWYGFSLGTNSSNLIRLDFGNSLANDPVATNLGNPGGILLRPRNVALIRHNGSWHGLVTNFDPVSGTARVVRLDFGLSLLNIPTATDLGNLGNRLTQPWAIKLKVDNGSLIALIGDRSERKILLVNFGASPSVIPSSSSAFIEAFLPAPGFFKDFDIIRFNDQWHGIGISESGSVQKIAFVNSLFSQPFVTVITQDLPAIASPSNVVFLRDQADFVAIVTDFEGNIIRLDFKKTPQLNAPLYANLGKGGLLQNNQGLAMVKSENQWYGFAHNTSTSRLNRIHFSQPCSANPFASNLPGPTLSFAEDGMQIISLEGTDNLGEMKYFIDSLLIKRDPQPGFTFTHQCTGQPTLFADISQADGVILNWIWDFDDAASGTNSSTLQNPTHEFSQPGTFNVQLTVVDECGNNAFVTIPVEVTDANTTDLAIDSENTACSFQPLAFAPVASFGLSTVTETSWNFADGSVSTLLLPTHEYQGEGFFNVQLTATVSNCLKSAEKLIEIKQGNQIDFTSENQCQLDAILFTSQSVGLPITLVQWDFGDGNSSQDLNPSHAYQLAEVFPVTLEITNTAGCLNSIVKSITIYSLPQPDFSLDLPPFSCSGSPSQFNDLTPNPTDSNLSGWNWDFGDGVSSSERNATHTYSEAGPVDVTLQVTTNFGCQAAVQKTVNIAQSPLANFIFGPACVGQPTAFSDASDPSAGSWQWKIGNTTYNQQNPTHVFSAPGPFTAELTITGTNGCLTTTIKTVDVPVVPGMDFEWTKNCVGQSSLFTDTTPLISDPVVGRLWTFSTLGTATGSPAQFTFNNTGTLPVSLTATYQSGCSYSISKNVTVVAAPVASFTATPDFGVPPLLVQFANTSSNVVSQLWSFGDADNSTSTALLPSFTYGEAGSFNAGLTVFNAQGCSASAEKSILVANPNLDIELTELQLSPLPSGEIIVSVVITNKGNFMVSNIDLLMDLSGAATLTEKINITLLPGQSTFRLLSTGIIDLQNQVNYLCVEIVRDGDADLSNNKQCKTLNASIAVFNPFPNPSADLVHLEWVAQSTGNATASLFDAQGKVVFNQSLTGFSVGLNRLTIPLSGIKPGTYFVLFVAPGTRKSFPVIVNR